MSEWLYWFWVRKDVAAARAAFVRFWDVPYMAELNEREIRGMVELERRGEVIRDDAGFTGIHWHRRARS